MGPLAAQENDFHVGSILRLWFLNTPVLSTQIAKPRVSTLSAAATAAAVAATSGTTAATPAEVAAIDNNYYCCCCCFYCDRGLQD